jgi:hypothetical protein
MRFMVQYTRILEVESLEKLSMEPTLQCYRCGNEFTPKKWWARFCSLECRNGWWSYLRKLERKDKREVRVLARDLAKDELTRQGLRLAARDLQIAADQYLAAHPELIEEAAKRLSTAEVKKLGGLHKKFDAMQIVEGIKYGRPVAPVVAENGLRRRAL